MEKFVEEMIDMLRRSEIMGPKLNELVQLGKGLSEQGFLALICKSLQYCPLRCRLSLFDRCCEFAIGIA